MNEPIAPGSTLEAAWLEQDRWAQAANRAKRAYMRWQTAALTLTLAAAAAATLSSQIPSGHALIGRGLSFSAALLVAFLTLVGRNKTSPERMREWIRARSASEGLKSEVYLFVTRADYYRQGDARAKFFERVAAVTATVSDLSHCIADLVPAPKAVPDDPMSPADYIAQRVDAQITGYYRRHAANEARRVRSYRSAEFVLALIAATLGVWAGVMDQALASPWAAVVTTAIAALAAHLAAGRHEYQATTYMATALQLERLSAQFKDGARERPLTPDEVDHIIKQCEAAISVENQAWMARWERPAS